MENTTIVSRESRIRGIMLAACAAIVICAATPVSAMYYWISHWDFSSDALGEFDYTGCNDLVNTNGVPVVDGAMVFDGTVREVVTLHCVDIRSDNPHTIECFVQADSDCDGMVMELSANNNDNLGGFYLYAKEGVMARTSERGFNGENFKSGNICDGKWHHVAVIIDPKTNVVADSVRLYLDYERQGVRSRDDSGVVIRPHRLYVGSRGGTTLPFKGKIDDVRVTEGVLATNEMLQTRSTGSIDVRAFWKFDAEAPLADSSGNGNTLQGSQGVTFANGYASFNGTASDVQTVDPLDLSAYTNVTVECFVRRHVDADSLGMILEHSKNYFSNPQGFYMSLDESRVGAVQGNFRFGDGYRFGISPAYAVNSGWHHVALVKDASDAGNLMCVKLYVDGVRMGEYGGSGSLASGDLMRNDFFYIGSRANSAYFLDADIDDVRVTANVLTPGQFLRTRTGALDDDIAYWPFDKAKNMLKDASGNGNVLTGTGVTVTDGAAVFDGSQSGFATLAPLPLYAYRSLTVEWFMKTSASDVSIALETSENFSNNPGSFIACPNENAGFRMLSGFNALMNWFAADGSWHHYALVYDWDDTTADIVRIYRDGTKVTTPYQSMVFPARPRAARMYIGARAGDIYKFVGELDDIKITGRVLEPAEFMTKRSMPPGLVISLR